MTRADKLIIQCKDKKGKQEIFCHKNHTKEDPWGGTRTPRNSILCKAGVPRWRRGHPPERDDRHGVGVHTCLDFTLECSDPHNRRTSPRHEDLPGFSPRTEPTRAGRHDSGSVGPSFPTGPGREWESGTPSSRLRSSVLRLQDREPPLPLTPRRSVWGA